MGNMPISLPQGEPSGGGGGPRGPRAVIFQRAQVPVGVLLGPLGGFSPRFEWYRW